MALSQIGLGGKSLWLKLGGVVFLSFVVACARIVTPEGGPKDTTPPRILKMTPPQNSVNFKERRLRFRFDEYVQIKEPEKHLLISPPPKYRVYPLIKGKIVELPLRDTLLDSTTYVVDFGRSIVDLTEGNPLGDFQYVFSTGAQIDTCYLRGRVRDALLHTPSVGTKILLYREDRDSLPYERPPDFWAQTNAEGLFTVRNLPNESFRIVALSESNNNMLFDKQEELIAFKSYRVQPSCQSLRTPSVVNPSVQSQSEDAQGKTHQDHGHAHREGKKGGTKRVKPHGQNQQLRDSIARADSLLRAKRDSLMRREFDTLQLDLFSSYRPPQVRLSHARPRVDRLTATFSCPPEGKITLQLKEFPDSETVVERNPQRDTVSFWLMDTLALQPDTLQALLSYSYHDSIGLLTPRTDTLRFIFTEKKGKKREKESGRKSSEEKRGKGAKERSKKTKATPDTQQQTPSDTVSLAAASEGGAQDTTVRVEWAKIPTLTKKRFHDTVLTIALSTASSGRMLPSDTVWIACQDVPRKVDSTGIRIIQRLDSATVPYSILRDSCHPRRFGLVGNLNEATEYQLLVDTGALENLWGKGNMGTSLNLTTVKPNQFAQLHLHFVNAPSALLVEVISVDAKPRVIRSGYFEGSQGTLTIKYVPPGAYGLRLIDDVDGNREWSKGLYLQRKPCEAVRYFKDASTGESTVRVRSNWEYDLNIDYSQLEQ